ncbi:MULTISPECIES: LLM class flavin-dependent oxidoreductase [unclassified Micromonospora]|uniref:LLM class flavin-dependent oxidoreductase n=1 Tax=unclassified Micromonospora TaxID=2617518 RepID=UPI001C21C995|nr:MULTISPECIES: LLM class flavin-dependent oxidoreductase [unclassified Micromonospora]MBU8861532.1 LLM class flavin-dependent oxidoreductase [Micromonospora sp. WMMB482]MDM4781100.1 LLM class flavin-dependent oxidoreductase [Micromonospora sp. b486]
MTADHHAVGSPGGQVQAHLFLLAGHRAGGSHAEALADAHRFGLAAEDAGYAGVWIAEHHFISYGVCPSATAFAAHLLGATRRIVVGTAACVLSVRHPVGLAEEAVLLDELSGGRFRLGIARGGPWVDVEVFGTGEDRYSHGMADAVEILLRWLSGAATVAGNPRFPFRPVQVVPRPRRPVPTWVAATSPATVDLAARHGLPLLLGLHADLDEKRSLLARYGRIAAEHGHDSSQVPHGSVHLAHVDDTDVAAARAVRDELPGLLAGTREYVRLDGGRAGPPDIDAYVRRLVAVHPVGSPDRCRAAVAAAAALPGVRHLLFLVEATGDRTTTLRTIDRFSSEVLHSR